jgi:polyisoprenyl-teichoic acid--peptidoglycan teichoic acid transferase
VRRALWSIPILALMVAIVSGAHSVPAPTVHAQTQTPAIEIHRVQKAEFAPAQADRRPIFILALGSDGRPGVCMPIERCRADSIHLIGINAQKGSATILGFPRDSYVNVPGAGTRRINEGLFYGGPQLMVETVESITGISVDYYMLTSFAGLKSLVNGVGGIQIEILYPMNDAASGSNFAPGRQKLDGGQALAFTRDRHSAPVGDFGRSENQGRLMVAALQKLRKDIARRPSALLQWIQVGVEHIDTDLTLREVFDLALAVSQIDHKRVKNLVVPGGTGSAGGASVVFISGAAEQIYADLGDDGIVQG